MNAEEKTVTFPTRDYESLTIRNVYRIHSRNLRIGVFDGKAFTGIREKFGSRYLDTEWAGSTVGDVYEDFGPLPEGVRMDTRGEPPSVCGRCGKAVEWRQDPDTDQHIGKWYYVGTDDLICDSPWGTTNEALFAHLDGLEGMIRRVVIQSKEPVSVKDLEQLRDELATPKDGPWFDAVVAIEVEGATNWNGRRW
jgi:hypothetical protein